jgi:hypothetical protein
LETTPGAGKARDLPELSMPGHVPEIPALR